MTGASEESCAESLSWSVRLLRTQPARVAAVYIAALGAGVFGTLIFHNLLMGFLGFAMILGSTAEYWLGASYRVDGKEARAKVGLSLTAMEWQQVKRVVIGKNSVKLSPLKIPTKADAFRGVTLRTTPVNFDEVVDFVKSHCGEETSYETSDAAQLF